MDRATALQEVADNRVRLEALDRQRESLLVERRGIIRAALDAGATRTEIAGEAGVSRQRVVQIEEGRAR